MKQTMETARGEPIPHEGWQQHLLAIKNPGDIDRALYNRYPPFIL